MPMFMLPNSLCFDFWLDRKTGLLPSKENGKTGALIFDMIWDGGCAAGAQREISCAKPPLWLYLKNDRTFLRAFCLVKRREKEKAGPPAWSLRRKPRCAGKRTDFGFGHLRCSALENSGSKSPQTRMDTEKNGVTSFLSLQHGAGEGNRTPVFSLGSWCSAIELLPQRCNLSDALPFYHIFMGIAREKCGGETKLFFDAILQKSSIYFT